MALLATVLLAVIAVADFRVARRLSATPRRALGVAFATLLFVLTYLYLTLFNHLLANVPWDDFIYFERLPAHAGIMLIVALCWYLPGRISRGTIVFLILLGGGYGLLEVGGPMLLPLYAGSLSDRVQRLPSGEIEVMQSTAWSCGPAALAWALQTRGLPATERQLARLAASTPCHGTVDAGLVRACRKLGVSAVMRRSVTFEELEKLPMPCLATWHLSGALMHEIAILRVEPDKVEVGDPMMGRVEYTRAEFEHKWMKDALVMW